MLTNREQFSIFFYSTKLSVYFSFPTLEFTLPDYRKFEDTKGVIRSRKSKKARKCNGQKKKTNNDLQNITQTTTGRATRIALKREVNSGFPKG